MSADSSDQDLKALWQDQPPETDPMTLEHIQKISHRLDRRQRRTVLIGSIVAAGLTFEAGELWQRASDPFDRTVYALLAIGAAGFVFMIYRLTHLTRDPAEPAGVFLRRRLAQGLRPGRALLSVTPLLPGMAGLIAIVIRNMARNAPHLSAGQWALQLLPLVILAGAWLFTQCVGVPRARRKIRERIEELDAMLER